MPLEECSSAAKTPAIIGQNTSHTQPNPDDNALVRIAQIEILGMLAAAIVDDLRSRRSAGNTSSQTHGLTVGTYRVDCSAADEAL